jgi:hypothetical protein
MMLRKKPSSLFMMSLNEVQFPEGAMMVIFLFRHRVQTSSGAHPASYPMGTEGFYPGSKAAGA